MKSALLIALAAMFSDTAHAATVLRLGSQQGPTASPAAVAAEFTAAAGYQDQFHFYAGELPYLRTAAAIPGMLADSPSSCISGASCTSYLSVHFTVPESMDGYDFDLRVERLGSEWDAVLLDGVTIGGTSGSEDQWMGTKFELGILSAGDHSITLWQITGGNVGTDASPDHFIDRIVLMAD